MCERCVEIYLKHTENILNVSVVLKSFHRTENILMRRATLLSGWMRVVAAPVSLQCHMVNVIILRFADDECSRYVRQLWSCLGRSVCATHLFQIIDEL